MTSSPASLSPIPVFYSFVRLSVCPCPGVSMGAGKTWPQGSVLPSLGLMLLGEECAHWALDALP